MAIKKYNCGKSVESLRRKDKGPVNGSQLQRFEALSGGQCFFHYYGFYDDDRKRLNVKLRI